MAAFNHLKTRLDFKVDPLILPPKTTNILNTELYDNIFLQPYYLNEYNGQSDVCLFDEDIFGNDDKKAKRISDHRPVWAEFNTHKDDDPKKPESDAGDSGKVNTNASLLMDKGLCIRVITSRLLHQSNVKRTFDRCFPLCFRLGILYKI